MLSVILLISGLSIGEFSKIETGLTNTIAKVRDTVVFSCVTKDKDCSNTDWSKQEGIQSAVAIYKSSHGMLNNNTYPWDRYSVSPDNGCSLTILDLKLNDSGLYSCSEAQERHFVLAVVEHKEECQTNATNATPEGTVYNDRCEVKFNPTLIKPWKIVLSWTGGHSSSSNKSTEADTVVLDYAGKAMRPVIHGYNCSVNLSVEQSLQDSHDKTVPRLQACTLPSIKVQYPVTKITCTDKYGNEKYKFGKSETVMCVADGYSPPTCECKSDNTGETENCEFVIPETRSPGDTYTCTATNNVTGNPPPTATITVIAGSSLSAGEIIGIVIGVLAGTALFVGLAVFLYRKFILGENEKTGESVLPLKAKEKEPAPPKPPRASTNSNQGDK